LFSLWFCYFFQLNFNKLYLISLTKIVEITYAIYQGLSKRRLCKEYVRRKVNNTPGVNLRQNFAFASTPSFSLREITRLEHTSYRKTSNCSAVKFKKHTTSMSAKPEPAICSHDTGQWIACCDSCQLTIAWMPNIKDVAMGMVLLSVFKVLAYGWTDIHTYRQSCDNQNFSDQWVTKSFKVWGSA